MRLYNTLTRKIEEFRPLQDKKVLFYHCGPTVYWTQHIGNMRAVVMADLIRRTLIYLGYEVKFVRNYTDVGHFTSDADEGEDKMEKAARREKKSPGEIAAFYIGQFEDDINQLNVLPADCKPRASKYIKEIQEMISALINKGYAYATQKAVLFDTAKFPGYNRLNRQKIEENIKGAGKGEVADPEKKHFADFNLWAFKKGEHENALQTWPSPWGEGFPGWHIECSAMSKKLLGDTIDIHMGGVEHIPVHHTNEIAQSEAANGKKFVNYWLHNEHLQVDNRKMAKSEGTGYSLAELTAKGYDPLALRYFFLAAHYRSQQNFTWEALDSAAETLRRLRNTVLSLRQQTERVMLSEDKLAKIDGYRRQFNAAVGNDFQIPQALAVMWEMLKSNIPSTDKLDLLFDFDEIFGLGLNEVIESEIPDAIKKLAADRESARKNKDFKKADELRKEIDNNGYIVEDLPSGYKIKRK